MDIFDFLLLFTPIGIGTLLGIGGAYLICTYFPPTVDCTVPGALSVAVGFFCGVVFNGFRKRDDEHS